MPPHQLYARDNHGPELDRGIWAAVAIATLIVILRVFAKIKINHFRADDVLMVLASVCLPFLVFTPSRCILTSCFVDPSDCLLRFPHALGEAWLRQKPRNDSQR